MKITKILAIIAVLGILAVAAPNASAQRVVVGVGVGPGVIAGPPVCTYGYYNYYPYACAPYGYYGPDWFVGGVFIGAGPWFHGVHPWGFYSRPGFWGGRGFEGRGFAGRPGFAGRGFAGRGFEGGRGFAGRPAVRGGAAPRGGFAGRGSVAHGSAGGFHGGGSHGGGGRR